ncbi:hypothetical protein PsorP6_013655 [Peronosclerospora sorghi]|uniref:Uncharacterized protein n=1 Tax=Peronosclerospora sorghi TaxID=230839 RepID=A0ACC0VFN0_9STRA|nr:hypothetical protein PsorP6_013655 [Peronosclerospora sorghi]
MDLDVHPESESKTFSVVWLPDEPGFPSVLALLMIPRNVALKVYEEAKVHLANGKDQHLGVEITMNAAIRLPTRVLGGYVNNINSVHRYKHGSRKIMQCLKEHQCSQSSIDHFLGMLYRKTLTGTPGCLTDVSNYLLSEFVGESYISGSIQDLMSAAFFEDHNESIVFYVTARDVSTFDKKTLAVEDAAVPKQGSGSGSYAINSFATFQHLVIPQKISQWTEGNSTTWRAAWIERLLLGDKHYSEIHTDDSALKLMGDDEPPEMLHINGHDVQHFPSTALWVSDKVISRAGPKTFSDCLAQLLLHKGASGGKGETKNVIAVPLDTRSCSSPRMVHQIQAMMVMILTRQLATILIMILTGQLAATLTMKLETVPMQKEMDPSSH